KTTRQSQQNVSGLLVFLCWLCVAYDGFSSCSWSSRLRTSVCSLVCILGSVRLECGRGASSLVCGTCSAWWRGSRQCVLRSLRRALAGVRRDGNAMGLRLSSLAECCGSCVAPELDGRVLQAWCGPMLADCCPTRDLRVVLVRELVESVCDCLGVVVGVAWRDRSRALASGLRQSCSGSWVEECRRGR